MAGQCDVLISGSGPAGTTTALGLLRRRPELAGRVVALEKRRHPRPKVCAGGLIPRAMMSLAELGVVPDVAAVEVRGALARTPAGDVKITRPDPMCTIVRRDEFDAWLAREASRAGLCLIEDCTVLDVRQYESAIEVTTSKGTFRAAILVGADGSGSRVRRAVFGERKATIGRALMSDVAVDPATTPEFRDSVYRFDFNCVSAGIHGYAWSFPCVVKGRAHLNVGIYDQHPAHGAGSGRLAVKRPLADALRNAFPRQAMAAGGGVPIKAFPIRWFDAGDSFWRGRVILAGDAAGVDPLMGEGISCAIEHGLLAADAIVRMLDGDSLALSAYDRELRTGVVGRKLVRLGFAARRFYGPRHRLYFGLARMSRKAQELGVDWYNGAARFDELSVGGALARWARAVLFGAPVR